MERNGSEARLEPTGGAGRAGRAGAVVLLLAFCALTLWAYRPGIPGGFYFDDEQNIIDATALHWEVVSVDGVRAVLSDALLTRRPVANLSFALNHRWAGLDPAAFRWTNVVIHLAMGLVLAWTCLVYLTRIPRAPPAGAWAWLVAATVAGLFLLHPLNVQATTYVVQRMSALAALFTLLAFALYLLARRHGQGSPALFLGAGLCWLLAVGSKETALALPVVLLLYEWCFHRETWRERLRARDGLRWLPLILLATAGGAGVLALLYLSPDLIRWNDTFPGREFSGEQRVLTQARVQFFYLSLLLWPAPSRLNLEHDFIVSEGLFTPWTTSLALGAWVAIVAGALWLARRHPAVGFPALAYLGFHLLESGPINLELVFEHRMYLPLSFLCLGLAAAALGIRGRNGRALTAAGAFVIAVLLAVATHERNRTWGDTLTFLRDCAAKSPRKFRPHYNLGTELGYRGDYAGAEEALSHALHLEPDSSRAHNQLANVMLLTGRPGEALRHYEQAVELGADNAEAVYNLARQLDARGQTGRARALYVRFLDLAGPEFAPQRAWVARRLARGAGAPRRQRH